MSAHLIIFERERPKLQALAYRLLGSVTDAEDLLQETYLRWQRQELSQLQKPDHYLTRMVTHGAIDQLRSAKRQRESYTGPWLPEPWVMTETSPEQAFELAESLSTAFLLLLERLNPLERAVFLLRVVFDYEYAEIAELVGESQDYCRQLVHRAKAHLQSNKRPQPVDPERQQNLLKAFLEACQRGELERLKSLLAEDAVFYSDGGGKVTAALNPIYGNHKVARLILSLLAKIPPNADMQITWINGTLGLLVYWQEQLQMVLSFDWLPDGIQNLFAVLNPDKLEHLA